MCTTYALQPVTVFPETLASASHNRAAEPALADLMGDPMTEALMTADRVDRRELRALIAQMREHLAPLPTRRG